MDTDVKAAFHWSQFITVAEWSGIMLRTWMSAVLGFFLAVVAVGECII